MRASPMDMWDTSPPVLTVTQLNTQARQLLERSFASVQVAGEVSNLKEISGHRYFCLKDANALLNVVLFRREALAVGFPLRDGLEVVARGRLTVYPPSGRYQLQISQLELCGAGALQAAFEALKAQLALEGLFDQARKRPLPRLPRRVAVVTSPSGAVIRDIVHVSRRRFPNAHLVVVPTRVQGLECAAQVARAIERVSALAPRLGLDVLIVARGGGSLEDLWGFNDAQVARAIAAASVPVVSAVGHETDFTIADFVADCRAPTPSAAAELVFPLKSELIFTLQRLVQRLGQSLRQDVQRQRYRLRALRAELGDGHANLRIQSQRLVALQMQLQTSVRRALAAHRAGLTALSARLEGKHPRARLQAWRERLGAQRMRLERQIRWRLRADRSFVSSLQQRLKALSPLAVLGRGYGIVLTEQGQALRRADGVPSGTRLDIRLAQGRLWARAE